MQSTALLRQHCRCDTNVLVEGFRKSHMLELVQLVLVTETYARTVAVEAHVGYALRVGWNGIVWQAAFRL